MKFATLAGLLGSATAVVGPAWTYDDTVEKPNGELVLGSATLAVYDEEQQARLGVDATGAKTSEMMAIAMKVNAGNHGWKACGMASGRFGTLDDVKATLGARLRSHPEYVDAKLPIGEEDSIADPATIPDAFDSRTTWGGNCSVVTDVRDQSACGSCWAFSATETFESRRCIAGNGDVQFSPQDTAGCCHAGMSQGCNGGQQTAALGWMEKTGVVTGGDFFNKTAKAGGCKPYLLQPCAHHVPASAKYPACPSAEYSIQCAAKCSDTASGKTYATDKSKGTKAFSLMKPSGMQTAIMNKGPLAVSFTVYSDFPTYKSGVYKHTTNQQLGGHAVVMMGWGTENGTPYWLIKNSWNEQWGDHGYFKIARGTDECGIEDDVSGINF
jgi:cathepsin B